MSDALLAAWLRGGVDIAGQLPAIPPSAPGAAATNLPPWLPPGTPTAFDLPEPEGDAVISFPQIDIAARDLAARRVLTRGDFDALADEAKFQAFTVAKVQSLDVLEKLRDALSADVAQGGTLAEFEKRVNAILSGEGSALSPAHIENIYRTNIAAAYAEGQRQVLNHPLVADEFPYVEYTAVHDSRTRPEHLQLEKLGIGGGPIYRRDDPVVNLFWPPWDYQCRCAVIALTLEDAAAKGVAEAIEWLRTGQPPASPAWVKMPDFKPRPGFGNHGQGVGVRLSHAADAGDDPRELAEAIAEVLGGLFGEKALLAFKKKKTAVQLASSSWDNLAHPRGPGGRFIKKGSSDAVAAAKTELAKLKSEPQTPENTRKLTEHLAILSVKQLRELAKEHNLKCPAKLKAELVQKIAERLPGGVSKAADTEKPWSGGAVEHGKVYNAPIDALHVDPSRFQYKLNVDSVHGVTAELRAVKTFNPDFAGVLSVWRDPADGQTYVINGHHRYELALRTNHPDLAVRYIDAKDAKEARGLGALVNIAEGRGTAIDAAKFMRDSGSTPAELEARGVSLKGKLAAEAAIFTKLNDRLFNKVTLGTMDEQQAMAIAKHLDNHDLQDKLAYLLAKREDDGKETSTRVVEEMAREMASTPTTTKTESTLWGDIESEESLFVERNELKSHVRNELAREVNDFLAGASKRRAEKLQAKGNVLHTEANKNAADQADRVRNVYNQLVNRKGGISDSINEAAAEYAKAKTKKERDAVKQRAVEKVRRAVFREANVGSEG